MFLVVPTLIGVGVLGFGFGILMLGSSILEVFPRLARAPKASCCNKKPCPENFVARLRSLCSSAKSDADPEDLSLS